MSPGIALAQSDKPNIIVILVDDMGVMDSSVPFMINELGEAQKYTLNNWYHTPNMEQLALQGVRFSNFNAQSVSSPSRSSILTGQNSVRHRTTNWIDPFRNNAGEFGPVAWNWAGLTKLSITLPRVLKNVGYRTIHVGKSTLWSNWQRR